MSESLNHLRARIDRLEDENVALRDSQDRLRSAWNTARVDASKAAINAYRMAAREAANHCLHGDNKQYPSVIGAEIHDKIMALADMETRLEGFRQKYTPLPEK